MDLGEYLKSKKMPQKDFAKKLKCSPTSLTMWIKKKREPMLKIALRIVALTDGEVTLEDLVLHKKK